MSESPRSPSRGRSRTATVVAVVAALATVALLVAPILGVRDRAPSERGPAPDPAAVPPAQPDPDPTDDGDLVAVERREPGDPLALGEVDAPVVLVNYSDFQCPYCARWALDTKPALMEYVEDGMLRIEWRDFPYLGEESVTAAVAARAAGLQGAFWDFHDVLYAEEPQVDAGRLTEQRMEQIARQVGLDVEQFRTDLGDEQVLAAVRADFDQGQAIGVNATPAFLVNGEPILGAQPTEVFVEAVEDAAGRR